MLDSKKKNIELFTFGCDLDLQKSPWPSMANQLPNFQPWNTQPNHPPIWLDFSLNSRHSIRACRGLGRVLGTCVSKPVSPAAKRVTGHHLGGEVKIISNKMNMDCSLSLHTWIYIYIIYIYISKKKEMADDVFFLSYFFLGGRNKILLGCILVFSRMISTDLNPAARAPETLRDLKKVHKIKSQMKGFYFI